VQAQRLFDLLTLESKNITKAWTIKMKIETVIRSWKYYIVILVLSVSLPVIGIRNVMAQEEYVSEIEENLSELTASSTSASKKGLVKEGNYYRYYKDGVRLKESWKTIKGKRYYFKKNGNAATGSYKINGQYYVFDEKGVLLKPKTNAIVTVSNTKYYITPSGTAISAGWVVIGNKLYYVYRNGRCAANETIDKITFTKNGYAKNNVYAKLKIKCMEVISKVTTSSMTKSQKLRACWYYLNTSSFQAWKYPDTTKKDWPQTCALEYLSTRGGNCYGFATSFAALAKELGYEPYVIEIPRMHCWVQIDGLYWDNMGNRMGTTSGRYSEKYGQKFKF
jgi:hypothetical protein